MEIEIDVEGETSQDFTIASIFLDDPGHESRFGRDNSNVSVAVEVEEVDTRINVDRVVCYFIMLHLHA